MNPIEFYEMLPGKLFQASPASTVCALPGQSLSWPLKAKEKMFPSTPLPLCLTILQDSSSVRT